MINDYSLYIEDIKTNHKDKIVNEQVIGFAHFIVIKEEDRYFKYSDGYTPWSGIDYRYSIKTEVKPVKVERIIYGQI